MSKYQADIEQLFDFLLGQPVEPEALRKSLENLNKNSDVLLSLGNDSRFLETVAAMNEGVIFPEMQVILEYQDILTHLYPEAMTRLNSLRADPDEPGLELMPYPTLLASPPFLEWVKVVGGEFQHWQEGIRLRFSLLLTPPAPALSFAGLKGKKTPVSDLGAGSSRIHLDPEQTGGAEIEAILQRGADEGRTAALIVRVIIPERWPQLDGIVVKAKSQGWEAEGVTDAEGEFTFHDVSAEAKDSLEISVILPKI
jgi:hypothetical protein